MEKLFTVATSYCVSSNTGRIGIEMKQNFKSVSLKLPQNEANRKSMKITQTLKIN